jgi:hypothetical protein
MTTQTSELVGKFSFFADFDRGKWKFRQRPLKTPARMRDYGAAFRQRVVPNVASA